MTLTNAPLFYPSARDWMWDYCVYLGPFTDSAGDNYDLGIYLNDRLGHSGAIVSGNEPGDYFSGDLRHRDVDDGTVYAEKYNETWKRARALNLIK